MRSSPPACRGCGAPLTTTLVDLGTTPLSNAYLTRAQLDLPEMYVPLHAYVCNRCLLVQIEAYEAPESIFNSSYPYFSSYSDAWLEHSRAYAHRFVAERALNAGSLVVEVASNDGYLLREFVELGIPVLGIEPASNVAERAIAQGVETRIEFFGVASAQRLVADGHLADVLVANNTLAHVPDLHDFIGGMALVLKPDGLATIEFPHALRTIVDVQFDQIYHEHYSYLTLVALEPLFAHHGLRIVDVEELWTHGGSLRLFVRHAAAGDADGEGLHRVRLAERTAGLHDLDTYRAFGARVAARKHAFLRALLDATAAGRRIAAYGAPAKGNTLLVTCGIKPDLIPFTVDRSPYKQKKFLPGTRIPIYSPEHLRVERPDLIVLLAWNFRDEIVEQLADVRAWGARFLVAMPEVEEF